MSDFNKDHLNAIQRASFNLVIEAIEYSRKMRDIVAPNGYSSHRGITDFSRCAISLPQRSGVSVFGQFLCEHLLEAYPDERIIRLASEELLYGEGIEPRIDFINVREQTDYGRARQRLRNSEVGYSFVIVDQSEWVCGKDARFEGLAEDIFRPNIKHQFLINLST